jgi:hypothetical protein
LSFISELSTRDLFLCERKAFLLIHLLNVHISFYNVCTYIFILHPLKPFLFLYLIFFFFFALIYFLSYFYASFFFLLRVCISWKNWFKINLIYVCLFLLRFFFSVLLNFLVSEIYFCLLLLLLWVLLDWLNEISIFLLFPQH